MPWSSLRIRRRGFPFLVLLWLLLLVLPLAFFSARTHAAEEKRLTVYAPQAIYSLKLADHGSAEYVDLYALMQPLAKPEMKLEAQEATVKVNKIEGHFTNGSDKAKIGK